MPLPSGLREHVRAYLHEEQPAADAVVQIWHRLGRSIEDVDEDPLVVWTHQQRSWRRTAVGLAIGAAAGLLLTVGTGIGVRVVSRLRADAVTSAPYSAGDHARRRETAVGHTASTGIQQPTKTPVREDVPEELAATKDDVPTQAPATVGRAKRPTPGHVQPSALESLKSELDLLERAQAALGAGNPAGALALLERHTRDHPNARLREEREALRAIALCEAGNPRQGRAEARIFLGRHASSTFAVRVRSVCGIEPTEAGRRGQ